MNWSSKIRYFEKLSKLTIYQWHYLKALLAHFGRRKNRIRIAEILAKKEVIN